MRCLLRHHDVTDTWFFGRYREKTGQSAEEMEKMECTRVALECQSVSQNEELEKLRREMAICITQKQLSLEQLRQKDVKITDLHVDVEKRESKIVELEERLRRAEDERRKLHNVIQELKGNIRVFCRVRPVKEDEKLCEPGTQNPILTFPPTGPFVISPALEVHCVTCRRCSVWPGLDHTMPFGTAAAVSRNEVYL